MQRPGWKNMDNYFPIPQSSEFIKLPILHWGRTKIVFYVFFCLNQNRKLDALKLSVSQ